MCIARIALAIGLCLVLVVTAVGSAKEEEEPPLLFALEVNGVDYRIEPGELVTIPPQKGKLQIRLRMEPFRILKTRGAEFRFPRNWSSHREGNVWFAQHSGFSLEVATYRGSDANDLAESWAKNNEELGRRLKVTKLIVVRGDRPLNLGGAKVKGVTVRSDIGTVRTAYFLGSGRDTVRLLLTDDKRRGDEPSEEWREMERWLEQSLVLPN